MGGAQAAEVGGWGEWRLERSMRTPFFLLWRAHRAAPFIPRAMDAILQPALVRAEELEVSLGLPRGSVPLLSAGLVLLLTILFFLLGKSGGAGASQRAGGAVVRSAKAIKNTVLLVGPPGSGKTAMLHRVRFANAEAPTRFFARRALCCTSARPLTHVFPAFHCIRAARLRQGCRHGALRRREHPPLHDVRVVVRRHPRRLPRHRAAPAVRTLSPGWGARGRKPTAGGGFH